MKSPDSFKLGRQLPRKKTAEQGMQYTAIDLRKGESIFIYGLSLSKKNSENNYQGESEGMEYRKQ